VFVIDLFSIGYESIILISTSKIKNRMATRKNWNENGRWDGDIMLNPHSNWLDFSLYEFSFFWASFTAVNRISTNSREVVTILVIFIFCFSF
jgi:hypothetical protein